MAKFKRGLSGAFVDALNTAYSEPASWWQKILEDRDLFVGIRGNSLNVYYNGASLLRLRLRQGSLVGKTHFKFLLKEKRPSPYVRFRDGKFDAGDIASIKFSKNLPQDLARIKNASAPFHGIEAKGVHDIIRSNDNVLDTEIAFGDERSRIDIAALREGKRRPELVFYEAKHYSNPEIFGERPSVVDQVRRYQKILSTPTRAKEVRESYAKVVSNIAALDGFPDRLRTLCRRAAKEGFDVSTDVRLVIYGYDRPQQRAAMALFALLRKQIGEDLVLTRGNPRGLSKGVGK